jgi:hypothetical protein
MKDFDSDLVQDAMRYRWLRSTQNQRMRSNQEDGCIENIFVCDGEVGASSPNPDELDRCVDREMAKWLLVMWGRNAFTKGTSTDVVVQGEKE